MNIWRIIGVSEVLAAGFWFFRLVKADRLSMRNNLYSRIIDFMIVGGGLLAIVPYSGGKTIFWISIAGMVIYYLRQLWREKLAAHP